MKSYFQMDDQEKRRFQAMYARHVQKEWESSIITRDLSESYEKWLNKYLENLELTDQFELLQAFIDYYKNDNQSTQRI